MQPTNEREQRWSLEIQLAICADRESGSLGTLESYLARYPGHDELVARLWLEARPRDDEPEPRAEPDDDGRSLGRYRLLEELGRGGQGVVYLAEDPELGRRVALKVLRDGFGVGDEALLRFRREAELASKLDHPGICTVYEAGHADGRDFLAMRYVEGESLAQSIRHARESGDGHVAVGGEPRARPRERLLAVVELVEKAARALHAAHERGIVHRDVKPSNLRVTPDGEPVVVDFGLARDASVAAGLTLSGDVFGTPQYMAPEQVEGTRSVDRRADVWSLGATLFELLCLEPPFSGPTWQAVALRVRTHPAPRLRTLRPDAPRDLEVVVATALEPDLARRYQTAADLAEDLRRVRALEPIRARPAGLALRMTRFAQRRPATAASAGLLAVSLLTIGGLWRSFDAERDQLEEQRDLLAEERDDAIDQQSRLTDHEQSSELLAREGELWPVGPDLIEACDAWLEQVAVIRGRHAEHRANLEHLRTRRGADGEYPSIDLRTLEEMLERILANTDELAELEPRVRERRARSSTLARRSVEEHAEAWGACIEAVGRSSLYDGLVLAPQLGLVPLGANPGGAWEFWHVESGERPPWTDDGGAAAAEGAGIVLVLVPGGSFHMGCHPVEGPNLDPLTNRNEVPPHEVALAPYFVAKFETTQDQWVRCGDAENPSKHPIDKEAVVGEWIRPTNPVETVSAVAADRFAARLGLALPTEAQWEAACRAGTHTVWSFGDDPSIAGDHGNFLPPSGRPLEGYPSVQSWSNRFERHAPVGSFLPNGWGLHDMHGNVWEWCRDAYAADYRDPAAEGDGLRLTDAPPHVRPFRGGGFTTDPTYARCAVRSPASETGGDDYVGFRVARAVDPRE